MNSAPDPRRTTAINLHKTGRLGEAIVAYEVLLAEMPEDADLLHLTGLARHQFGDDVAAVGLIRRAIARRVDAADFHNHLGLALSRLGRAGDADTAFRRCLLLAPGMALAWHNLGLVAEQRARADEAISMHRRAVIMRPGLGAAWDRLVGALRVKGDAEAAETTLAQALKVTGGTAGLWFQFANLRTDLNDLSEAEAGFRRALELDPNLTEAAANLSNLLRKLRRRDEAGAVLHDGLGRIPGHARLWSALAAVDFERDQLDQALIQAQRACVLEPRLPDGPANLAQSLHALGQCAEAARVTKWALAIDPCDRALHLNQATHLLGAGQLRAGWQEYGWRLGGNDTGLPEAVWSGPGDSGRRLLVLAEQGLGDEIVFASCYRDLSIELESGHLDSVTVECDPRLLGTIARSFPSLQVIPRRHTREIGEASVDYSDLVAEHRIDRRISAGSLPAIWRRTISEFPDPGAYLQGDPERCSDLEMWLTKLGPGRRIGICWRSRRDRDRDRVLYPRLDDCVGLIAQPGAVFVNLQYDAPEAELSELETQHGATVHRPPLDLDDDLDGVLALMAGLDGIITADTAVFMLAGAAAKPAIVVPYGYWWPTFGSGRVPWFPKATVVSRVPGEAWSVTMRRVTEAATGKFQI